MLKRRAVFLDRDGVLNQPVVRNGKARSPRSLEDFVISPGTDDALRALREAGFLLIVATNQPEVARGLQQQSVVERMHDVLRTALPLDDILVCYHDEGQSCSCRKPAPGLMVEAAAKWGIELEESYMIGDRWKDIEAGHRAGCKSILLVRSYDQGDPDRADFCAQSVSEAAAWILGRRDELPGSRHSG